MLGIEQADFEPVLFDQIEYGRPVREMLMANLASSDCVVADFTGSNPNIYLEVGFAQAMGKAIFPIVNGDEFEGLPFDMHDIRVFTYQRSPSGLTALTKQISSVLREFRKSPRQASFHTSPPFFIDWNRLTPSDTENLCRELLSQMGFRKLDWFQESPDIDLIAEYPRKDPDGFDYRELWLVSMGRNKPLEILLQEVAYSPEKFVHHVLRPTGQFRRFWTGDDPTPITLLFIAVDQGYSTQPIDALTKKLLRRSSKSRYPFSVRVRMWDSDYLATLVQKFPSIAYKYFSDEARFASHYRKGQDELYRENLSLVEQLAATVAALEEEKNRRVSAERDAVWKDISFTAAHKIGNPIFAIETDLDPLQKRIVENRSAEATEVVANIRCAVEKAKAILDQFKSLTKAQQIVCVPTLLLPILQDCCRLSKAQAVKCRLECSRRLNILGDPDRLAEAFDELTTNALYWLDNRGGEIRIDVTVVKSESVPVELDRKSGWVHISFQDNGPGVEIVNKEKIFGAFFTTSEQGTGLGLALVRRIIEGHGGRIVEAGVPGEGAVFDIHLPLVTDSGD